MMIYTIRYKLTTDNVQLSYLKSEIRKSKYMYEQACRYFEHRSVNTAQTIQEVWVWLKHYQHHYIKEMGDDELYIIWKQVQRHLLHTPIGAKKRFFKCEGMHSLIWRRFPLNSCMKIDKEWKKQSIQKERITNMKIWYKKHVIFVEISYRL